MEFNTGLYVLVLVIVLLEIWMVLDNTRNINEQQEKGIVVENKFWKAICFLHKPYEKHLSYVSVVFLVIGYVYLLAAIPLFIISFCSPSVTTTFLVCMHATIIWVTAIIERFFMPSYGMMGHH